MLNNNQMTLFLSILIDKNSKNVTFLARSGQKEVQQGYKYFMIF